MLLVPLVSNNFTNYGRRHFKLFTNCHVFCRTPINVLLNNYSELETNLQAKMGQNNPIIKIKQFRKLFRIFISLIFYNLESIIYH